MAEYNLEVTTGNKLLAGTSGSVYVTLIGAHGESARTNLDNDNGFSQNQTSNYTIKASSPIGKILLVKVEKEAFLPLLEDEWFLSKIVVTTPERNEILFPCYRWITSEDPVELRGGKAKKVNDDEDDDSPIDLVDLRKKELSVKRELFQWRVEDGVNRIREANGADLPSEVQFKSEKQIEFAAYNSAAALDMYVNLSKECDEKWTSFEEMKSLMANTTPTSDYVTEHWKEDDFYGYQFLNGVSPNDIKRCTEVPPKFAVTAEMVEPFLEKGSSLQGEMKKGNIFLIDQRMMDGIPGRKNDGKELHVIAGFCLLYLTPDKNLKPIAIQLKQQPSEQNPVFLPSDSETDWLLAKMFIKSSHYIIHQSVHHLMNTHFLGEAFTIATLRCFPVIHPLYKLLIPHFRDILFINTEGRKVLLGEKGALSISSIGKEGTVELINKSLTELTYSDLCLPDNIIARGLESIPNFYYRDDGQKLWKVINSFVRGVVEHYYPEDSHVQKDTELQKWIREIFTKGFLGNKASGIPDSFTAAEEVIKFITMVIFNGSGQHAAVNNGQFDYFSWPPNGSLLLVKPPPSTKGLSSEQTILDTLPTVGDTAEFVKLVSVLTTEYDDTVLLGSYKDRFQEPSLNKMIEEFQKQLIVLTEAITLRNKNLEVPYTYLSPDQIQNSVAI